MEVSARTDSLEEMTEAVEQQAQVLENAPDLITTPDATAPSAKDSNKADPSGVEAIEDTSNKDSTDATKKNSVEVVPVDIRELTIKNLDTGEEFIIGEKDPDFEYDNWEITVEEENKNVVVTEDEAKNSDNEVNNVSATASQKKYKTYTALLLSIVHYFTNYNKRRRERLSRLRESSILKCNNHDSNDDTSRVKTPFTKLSSFKFRRELGKGAFGRVLLAEAKLDGKLYALKIISKKNMRSSDKRQAKAERDILHAMGSNPHPFITSLKFAFQSENNLYLGMDFIPGGNLRELIRANSFLPEAWVKFYSAELVIAIAHLHSINVLYRDIKPHNVMIDSRGHITLIDFGLSKQDQTNDKAMTLVGTPDYSAPEVLKTGVHQIEKQKQRELEKNSSSKKLFKNNNTAATVTAIEDPPNIGYGKAADWWSLGVMIFEMLCGVPAFRGNDLRQTYQKVLFAEVDFTPYPDRFSTASKELLTGLLQKDPKVRLGNTGGTSNYSTSRSAEPPSDIIASHFFKDINWSNIYNKENDGPFIPRSVVFRSTSVAKSSVTVNLINETKLENKSKYSISGRSNTGEFVDQLAATPKTTFINGPIMSNYTVDRINKPGIVIEEKLRTSATAKPDDLEGYISSSPASDRSSSSEVIHLRESILTGNNQNDQLLDWSFIDENVLAGVISQNSSEILPNEVNNVTNAENVESSPINIF